MNFKKVMAAVAAMSLAACAAVIPASAATDGVTIKIDSKVLTVEELAAMNYTVPIFVTLTDNNGVNAAEFGVVVDERCDYTVISDPMEAFEKTQQMIAWSMTKKSNGSLTWQTWASDTVNTRTSGIILYMVTIDPEDAVPGAKFNIDYLEKSGDKEHIWNNGIGDGVDHVAVDHVAAGKVDWENGVIEIKGEEVPTEPPTTEPPTEPPTTEPPTEAPTTEAPTTEAPTTEAPTTEAPTTEAPTGESTTTTPGTGSPATGTADVLPIVGVAAAAAILGGVAIVSKKKED